MFYELVNARELSTVKISRGTFLALLRPNSMHTSSEQLRGGDFGLPLRRPAMAG
jgi:hypothetical protein